MALLGAASSPSPTYWIVQGPRLDAEAVATNPDAIAFFNDPNRIVLYPAIAAVPAPRTWHVILWRKYASLERFRDDLARGKVGSGVQIVGYDPEHWRFTPVDEQQDPIASSIAFAQLAHAHGYKVIVMPAENLAVINRRADKFRAFLDSGYASRVAPYVDFYHIQAQGLQHRINGPFPSYRSFVEQMVAQIHAANPNVIITAGISTNTPGSAEPTSGADMAAAAKAVSDLVSGYWINVVRGNNSTAVDALRLLAQP